MTDSRTSKERLSEERLRNTRAWAAARPDMSGSEVIVGAIDELLQMREDWETICKGAEEYAEDTADEPAVPSSKQTLMNRIELHMHVNSRGNEWLVTDPAHLLTMNLLNGAFLLLNGRLAAEPSEVQRDAERYRFLRQPGNAIVYAKDRNAWGDAAHPVAGHVRYDTAEQLDAAVDVAIGATPRASEPPSEADTKDAARYRWLRGRVLGSEYRRIGFIYGEISEIDAQIDRILEYARTAVTKEESHG